MFARINIVVIEVDVTPESGGAIALPVSGDAPLVGAILLHQRSGWNKIRSAKVYSDLEVHLADGNL
jgi:hypothetical protein